MIFKACTYNFLFTFIDAFLLLFELVILIMVVLKIMLAWQLKLCIARFNSGILLIFHLYQIATYIYIITSILHFYLSSHNLIK